MSFVFIITLFVLGFLAAADRIQQHLPGTKDLISFLKQSEGWVGLVSIFLALFWILRILRYIKYFSIYSFIALVGALVMLVLGILYAQGQLKSWSGDNEKAGGFLKSIVSKAEPLKETLGLVALIVAIVQLFIYIF